MKSCVYNRILSLMMCAVMLFGFVASAAYKDDFTGSYQELNCAEDDCDCLEPENNRFQVVSPSSQTNSYNEVVLTGTYEEVQAYYKKSEQTDGMPVIPPTTLKLEKFMRYTPYSDNDIIAYVNGRQITAYQVAVNAVMSGCSAEYMPVCIAFVKALENKDYLSSLMSENLTPMLCINGPLSRQIGIDNTQGMTTEEANIVIGRFIEFALNNLAGISANRNNPFGYVQPLVFSENEKACINSGWNPHHVENGYCLNDNVITASSFSMWGNNLTPATDLPQEIMKIIAWDITEKNLGALGSADKETFDSTRRTVFITEPVAKVLGTHYKSKADLEDALIENARQLLWMRAYAYYYGDKDDALSKPFSAVYDELKNTHGAQIIPAPDWMNGFTYSDVETIAVMKKGNTDIIVTGDSSRNKTQIMPGGASSCVKIELPEMWDTLLTGMNYKPLADFNLAYDENTVIPPQSLTPHLTDGTYRILAPNSGSNYLNREGRVYFEASENKLYYWAYGADSANSVILDPISDAHFISYLNLLGMNSSFGVKNGKLSEITLRFSSNARSTDKNTSPLTAEAFKGLNLSIHANNKEKSLAAGGVSVDNSTIIMSSTVTSFSLNLDGELVLGETSDSDFVKLNGNIITVNPRASTGAIATIGSPNPDKTYRTVTICNNADGTYSLVYNTSNTLSQKESVYYLMGIINEERINIPFNKTSDADVLILKKDFPKGTHKLIVSQIGTDIQKGNPKGFKDTIQRAKLNPGETFAFKASGGIYEFKYEISSNRLSAYPEKPNALSVPENGFTDVNKNDWYYESVDFVKNRGLMSGIGGTEFAPDSFLSRAMLVTILHRAQGCPESGDAVFYDVVPGMWYTKAISWAKEKGIVDGIGNNCFAPDQNITREQIAVILFNYSKLDSISHDETKNLTSFRDADKVSTWAVEAVEWAVGSGIINGKSSGNIEPGNFATRAEFATILKRYIVKYNMD